MRPKCIDDVAGQKHILGEGKILRRIIESNNLPNLIFYGPPGIGKTTVARIIAENSGKEWVYLNATTTSVSDIKEIAQKTANENGIILYLDEIQYFNKKQQQVLMNYIDEFSASDLTLVAATTENPSFYIYPAILSRSVVFEFKSLSVDDILAVIKKAIRVAEKEFGKNVKISNESIKKIAYAANGDVRKSINFVDILCVKNNNDVVVVSDEDVEDVVATSKIRYDRDGDDHYDLVSAYQKSMRGSDPDAAIYYLGRLLAVGDLPSACRRLLVCANEDVGLAYPQIIPIVKAAVDTALMVGLPEARLPLANAVLLVAMSPKSNSSHDAINAVMRDIEKGIGGEVPRHLKNNHYDGSDSVILQSNQYKYPHDYPSHYVKQQYLPDELVGRTYYNPCKNHTESKFSEYIKTLRK